MEKFNHTVTKFILVGFTQDPVIQLVLFGLFLMVYSVTVVGNITLIILISTDSRLHTPMYFFIGNLSFLDLWYSTVHTPKIMVISISEDKSISFVGCVAQFFFSGGLAYSECYLLAAMAYDRYMAISKPLLYAQVMTQRVCVGLVAASYIGAFVICGIFTHETFTMTFCGDNVIDDFFCDLPPLVKLACDVKANYHIFLYFVLTSNVLTPIMFILASYLFIIVAILKIHSTQGQLKAFSTCSSHLISVTLYFGSIFYIYYRPKSSYSLEQDKIVSLFYTVVFPMLNPMIYSLRNKDVIEALRKLFKMTVS
ncbi:olfactory receptor 1013-like [Trichosurus vulpecula]|uniref:olfactory receptor 1013-like n=1 Tax=Trichosurus vulpecula TaxID=9337 RepID=UPI00186B0BDF|nr:olfactory receptor 1013-like [Trichosurus vulpecula]